MDYYLNINHNMKKEIKKAFRQFLGEEPPKPAKGCTKEEMLDYKQQMSFHNKHLHAYLMGYERFAYKYDEFGQPKYYDVKQKYITKEVEE